MNIKRDGHGSWPKAYPAAWVWRDHHKVAIIVKSRPDIFPVMPSHPDADGTSQQETAENPAIGFSPHAFIVATVLRLRT